jgi:hypothetical protein
MLPAPLPPSPLDRRLQGLLARLRRELEAHRQTKRENFRLRCELAAVQRRLASVHSTHASRAV